MTTNSQAINELVKYSNDLLAVSMLPMVEASLKEHAKTLAGHVAAVLEQTESLQARIAELEGERNSLHYKHYGRKYGEFDDWGRVS